MHIKHKQISTAVVFAVQLQQSRQKRHLYRDVLHTCGSLYKINVITHTTQYSHGYLIIYSKHSPVEKSIIHSIHTRLAPPPQRCRTVPNTSDNARIPSAIGQRASPPLSIGQSSEALAAQPSSQYILPDSRACGTNRYNRKY